METRCHRLYGNCVFQQNSHTKKLSEILVVKKTTPSLKTSDTPWLLFLFSFQWKPQFSQGKNLRRQILEDNKEQVLQKTFLLKYEFIISIQFLETKRKSNKAVSEIYFQYNRSRQRQSSGSRGNVFTKKLNKNYIWKYWRHTYLENASKEAICEKSDIDEQWNNKSFKWKNRPVQERNF